MQCTCQRNLEPVDQQIVWINGGQVVASVVGGVGNEQEPLKEEQLDVQGELYTNNQ